MRLIFFIGLLYSSSLMCQYEYFNKIYHNGGTSNIVSYSGKYYLTGAEGGNADLVGYQLNDLGDELLHIPFYSSNFVWPQYGSDLSLNPNQDGFYFATSGLNESDEYVGLLMSLSLDFELNWLYEVSVDNPDTNSVDFQVAKEIEDHMYAFGYKVYDYSEGAGETFSNLLVTKLDTEGNLIWENEYDWSEITGGEYFLKVSQVHEMPNGEILICAARYHDWNEILIKMNTDGEILDWYEWGGELHDWMPYAVPLEDGKVMIAYQEAFDLLNDESATPISRPHLMCFDFNNMEPIWDIEYDVELKVGATHDLLRTSDGGYMIGGYVTIEDEINHPTSSQAGFILKTDSLGEFQWMKYYYHDDPTPEEDPATEIHELYDMDNTSDGGVVACGRFLDLEFGAGGFAWVFKIDVCGELEDLGCEQFTGVIDHQDIRNPEIILYPNPTSEILYFDFPLAGLEKTMRFQILDQQGRIVVSERLRGQNTLGVSDWASGVYCVQVLNVEGMVVGSRRFVVG